MFGGLHLELASLRSIGTLLHDSGWTSAICEANVVSSGTAESFLTASSIKRMRQEDQITACRLHNLMKKAYQDYCTDEPGSPPLGLEDWCVQRRRSSPQFQFWYLVLDIELAIFTVIRSFRERNFELYHYALYQMTMSIMNDGFQFTCKTRWSLRTKHPDVASEFHKGNFVIHKSRRDFSAMAIDQAHEQYNAVIKGDVGAIGLTEDPAALRRWMVAGTEVSRLLAAYEAMSRTIYIRIESRHHEANVGDQAAFFENVKAMTTVLKDMGNPFKEESSDLLSLDTKNQSLPTIR